MPRTPLGREGSRRSGVVPVMRYNCVVHPPTGLMAQLRKGDEHHAYTPEYITLIYLLLWAPRHSAK